MLGSACKVTQGLVARIQSLTRRLRMSNPESGEELKVGHDAVKARINERRNWKKESR